MPRTFTLENGHAFAGLACREQQRWRILTLIATDTPGPAGGPVSSRIASLGLPPLLLVIAAGLLAMVAIVWETPALRDVVELLWLQLRVLLGLG